MTVVLFFMTSLIYLAESVNSYTRVTVVITLINDKLSKFNTCCCVLRKGSRGSLKIVNEVPFACASGYVIL